MSDKIKKKNPMMNVMGIRDFRLLLSGSATSLLGDQLVFIATPWLVLQLTGDPLILGIILALEGIPRAAFMLIGGVVTDRFTPRLIMLLSDIIRLVITALMAVIIVTGYIQMWMLYVFALVFGLVAGFAVPAQNSIVPRIVHEKDLQAGNSIIMGITQLAGFIGPTAAGIIIGSYSNSMTGIIIAFAVDAITFGVSAMCLFLMKPMEHNDELKEKESMWSSIKAGIKFLWNDRPMRVMFFVVSAINFFFVGPFLVGVPVLASTRLAEKAVAFGILISAASGGNLLGFVLAGALGKPSGAVMKKILITVLSAFGVFMILLGYLSSTWIDAVLLLVLGIGNGYIAISFFTWIQKKIPKEMLGRITSILIFSNTGLIPVSQSLSGALSKIDLTFLFVFSGVMIIIVSVLAALRPELKTFAEGLAE